MNQPEPQKRMVLTRYWTGDMIYHRIDGKRGLIMGVHLASDRFAPRYYVAFGSSDGQWCEEMELTTERVLEGVEADKKP